MSVRQSGDGLTGVLPAGDGFEYLGKTESYSGPGPFNGTYKDKEGNEHASKD